ncbi:ferredoxin--NADP reductase [Hyalangium rubrum]|uniref:Ferredoxin--NADP reductase n=1 Tax=Hyalangium rubrum TaxID=3103134 RepID=A0ABU5HCC6_9BACT|nr:ferredoxin--NADP reductase [Hyalangium sp. s54d21]MDY7230981.1 ferredoxin--NADP reductase [Hyalangium sp. s54d21]
MSASLRTGNLPAGAGSAGNAVIPARPMRVARVVRETPDAVTLVLEDPTGAPVTFLPGQFFTVLATVEGVPLRRAYSASSAPGAEGASRVSLTIKRVPGGKVSNFLNDRIQPGMALEVLGPSGHFTPDPSTGGARHLVLLAGGSGITPLMSIARAALATEPATSVSLIYGNRREQDILFREALAELARGYAGRFRLRYVLSEPPEEWQGGVGMLNRYVLEDELSVLPGLDAGPAAWFLCGPEPMMVEARAALRSWGAKPERIHEERFSQPHLRSSASARSASPPQPVEFRTRTRVQSVTVAEGMSILEAGLSAGVPLRYSCTMGGCGSCRVKLIEGQVLMEEPNCLLPEERAQGQVLVCIGRPVTPVVLDVP